MNKFVKWGIVTVITVGLIGLGIRTFVPRSSENLNAASGKSHARKRQILPVKAIILQPQKLNDALSVSGSLLPDEEVKLSFETSGKITHIYFKEGATVSKGMLLAKINDAPLQAQLHKLEAQLKLKQDRLYRQKTLLEKEAVSHESYQEAEASLSALQAEIEGVKAQLEQTELRAPFSGKVGLREVSVGTYANPSTTVATLTKTDPLKVEFSVPERYAGVLKTGARLTFTTEGDLKPREASVYATDSHVNAHTRTFTVRAHYPNPHNELVPGRYVQVSLTTREYDETLAVPSEAIVSEMGIDKVFVYRNGLAQPAEIQKGLRTEAQVQVLQGLEPGDTVIVSGTMQLRTAQKVQISQIK